MRKGQERPPARPPKSAARRSVTKRARPAKNAAEKPPAKHKPAKRKRAAKRIEPAGLAAPPKQASRASVAENVVGRSTGRDERERERKAAYGRRRRADNSNIGPPPPCDEPDLRERCRTDLVAWHTDVFPNSTGLKPFGQVQLDSIAVSADAILRGGKVLKLEPRGFGKTTRTIQEVLWATCYALRRYVVVFCSSTDKADELIDGIRFELENSDLLFRLFPEIVFPFRALEGKNQRAAGQHIDGEPTEIELKRDSIVFPLVAGSAAGGARIVVKPFRNARGTQHRGAKGTERPDFVFLDDIQTDDSARFGGQVDQLQRKLTKSIGRLGGHFDTLAILATATVIEADDLADRLARDPAWLTVRYQMLASVPERLDLWLGEYADLRRGYVAGDLDSKRRAAKKATAFYKKNRGEMDRGGQATWAWAYSWRNPDAHEISAIQHGLNIWIDDGEETFRSECQNDPIRLDDDGENPKATREQIAASIIDLPRGQVPVESTRLVAHVDVHKRLLFYTVVACNQDETTGLISGHVLDYGTFPKQADRLFSLRSAKVGIEKAFPKLAWKAAVSAALAKLISEIAEKTYKSTAETLFSIDTILIDANWGATEAEVKKVIREHAHRSRLLAAHGKGIAAGKMPIEEWKARPGEEKGTAWIRKRQGGKGVKTFIFDANYWKTATHIALQADRNSKGGLTLFAGKPIQHELFINHLLSESATRNENGGRIVHEWKNPPGSENHWFDNVVACMAAASAEFFGRRRGGTEGDRRRSRFSI